MATIASDTFWLMPINVIDVGEMVNMEQQVSQLYLVKRCVESQIVAVINLKPG